MVYPMPPATARPMSPTAIQPGAGFYPRAMQQPMMPPASQPLVTPPGMGLDPAQMAALGGQMPPEMAQLMQNPQVMQQVAQMMQNPQVQAQLQQLEQMAKSGQLSPEMLQQAMGGFPMPGGPMPGMPSVLGDFSPGPWIRNMLIGVGMGLVSGSLLDRFMEGATTNKPSWLDWSLKKLETIPGVKSINDSLEGKLKSGLKLPAGNESTWLRVDGHYTADQVMENFYHSYLGQKGHLYPELRKMGLPGKVLNQLTQKTRNSAELTRLLNSDLQHFLPESVQQLTQAQLHGTNPLVAIQKTLSGWLPKGWVKPPKASAVTLRQLDRLVDKQHFMQWIQESVQNKTLSGNTAQKILATLEQTAGRTGGHAGDAFAVSLEQLVNKSAAANPLKKMLGLSGTPGQLTYDALGTALKAKTGARLPLWQALGETTQGLLSKDLVNAEKMTLAQVQQHLNRHHLVTQLGQTRPGVLKQLQSKLAGLLKRSRYMESYYRPVMEGEHALAQALTKKGIGPVGRFFGKMGYYLQRTLDGANLRLVKGKAVTGNVSTFGRGLISLFVFGLAVSAFCKNTVQESQPLLGQPPQPKSEAKPSLYLRTARFLDALANGLGGYMGFELGRSFIPQLRLLTKTPGFARFCNWRVLGSMPFSFTCGGFLAEFLIPGVMGVLVAYPIQKFVNMVFGDPNKIAQREQFEADKQRPFTSQRGILEGFAKGEIPKVPGVVPGIEAIAPDPNTLTPENVGLTPEQIASNPIATRHAQAAAQMSEEMKKSSQSTVWSYGGH